MRFVVHLSPPACGPADRCITCADEGIEMHVLTTGDDGLAWCADNEGTRSEVDLGLVAGVCPGDRVLVHAGVALTVLTGEPV